MITHAEIVGGILDLCRYPSPQNLSLGSILHRLGDKITYYLSELNLAPSTNWLLSSTTVTTIENESFYPISAGGWGRPINVETFDVSDPNFVRRDIPIVDYQDLDLKSSEQTVHTSLESARAVAFINEDGQWKIVIKPTPQAQQVYKIWFKPTTLPPPQLTGNFKLLDNFVSLLKVHTSMVCLPDCKWEGLNDTQNRRRREDIGEALMFDFQLLTPQFQEWKRSERQESVVKKRGWGSDSPFEDLIWTGF